MDNLVDEIKDLMEEICLNCKYAIDAKDKVFDGVVEDVEEIASLIRPYCEICKIRKKLIGNEYSKTSWQDQL